MSDIRQVADWRVSRGASASYERVLQSIGTTEFGGYVRDAVLSVTGGARRVYLFESDGSEETSLQYFHGEPGLTALFPEYRRWYLRQDPVCDAYRAAPRCSDVALQRVCPSHITSQPFRRRIFDEPGIVERVSVVQRGSDAWRVMSIARHQSDGRLSDSALDAVIALACLVLPMLPLNRARRPLGESPSVAQFEQRFAALCPALTARERQVCARAATGTSVEETARELGIAKTSVQTYRQRAYARLGVASPFELCALVAH